MSIETRSPNRNHDAPARGFAVGAIMIAAYGLAWGSAAAQTAPPTGPAPSRTRASVMTVMSSPPKAKVTLSGSGEVSGIAPFDLPAGWTGRYTVTVDGADHAKTRGVVNIPAVGPPYLVSEPPGLSPTLILRSLNYPGFPMISAGSTWRGMPFTVAATGGVFGAIRSHVFYRHAVKDIDSLAVNRESLYRRSRNRWLAFAGVVWGMSAIDYCVRSRMDVLETTPQRVIVGAPEISRGAVAWRSLLVPGAGQEFANQRTRGVLWAASEFAAGAASVIADQEYRRDVQRLELAEAALAADSSDITLYQEVDRRRDDRKTSKDLRDGLVLTTVSLHALNFIDALIMPIHRSSSPTERRFSAVTRFSPDRSEIALSLLF